MAVDCGSRFLLYVRFRCFSFHDFILSRHDVRGNMTVHTRLCHQPFIGVLFIYQARSLILGLWPAVFLLSPLLFWDNPFHAPTQSWVFSFHTARVSHWGFKALHILVDVAQQALLVVVPKPFPSCLPFLVLFRALSPCRSGLVSFASLGMVQCGARV